VLTCDYTKFLVDPLGKGVQQKLKKERLSHESKDSIFDSTDGGGVRRR
jgi:hypothetical protein